ncbi:hypothetical protein D3C73_567550 [compost metagenome]
MRGIVEGFEGDNIIIEIEGVTKPFPKSDAHPDIRVGDVVECIDRQWVANKTKTEERSKEIKKLMNQVWED